MNMDQEARRQASQKISKTDLNQPFALVELETYWCRMVFNRWEKWNFSSHCHSFFELHLSVYGEGVLEVDGRELVISPGTFLLIPPDKLHRKVRVSEDFEKFVWGFYVHEKEAAEMLAQACENIAVQTADARMMEAIAILLENAGSEQYGGYSVVRNEMYYIFLTLMRQMTGIKNDRFVPPVKSGFRSEMICKFIEDNLAVDLDASAVAANFSISERQLNRICQSENGMSFREMKVHIRMERIRNLLAATELSVEEIAARTGFADRYSLSKFFKKWEGMSPAMYKNSYRRN